MFVVTSPMLVLTIGISPLIIPAQGMETLAKDMNYRLDIQPPPNGEKWGENKNGTFSGLVGELQKDISDIGWANLFMVPERLVQ